MKKILVPFVVLTTFGGGCATAPPPPKVDSVETQIRAMTDGVEKLMAEMVSLDRYRMSIPESPPVTQLLPADHPLQKRTTRIAQGDVRLVLRKICDDAGLNLLVTGKSVTALAVYVSMRDQPLAKVLENIGAQIGASAEIRYRQTGNQIELRYK